MPKAIRSEDVLVIDNENDRILEVWFSARVSLEDREKRGASSYLFVVNIAGQEEKKTLSKTLDYSESIPEFINVCFFRKKLTLSVSYLDQLLNSSQTVQLYVSSQPGGDSKERPVSVSCKTGKTTGKKDRLKKGEDLISFENAEQLFIFSFDLIDLMMLPSLRRSVPLSPDSMFRDCQIEVRCGTPLLPPAKLSKYRPLKIEIYSILNLTKTLTLSDPLFLSLTFGNVRFMSQELCLQPDGKVRFARVLFLGTRTPLDVYQDVFFYKMKISLFRGTAMCLGTGAISLRAAVLDQQTEFSEIVHLIPSRLDFCQNQNCLTEDTVVLLRVDFFTPLPRPTHVLGDGRPAHGRFLTRGIIRMPYSAKWVPSVLEVFMKTLFQLEKAHEGSDVHQLKLDYPQPEVLPVKKKKKERQFNKAQSVFPLRPPSPPSAFESPFMIVTPPGISGFEVMDDNVRIIVLEGPAADVHKIIERLGIAAGHDPQLELLINVELFVPKRAYVVFPPLITVKKTIEANALLKPEIDKRDNSEGPAVTSNREVCDFNQEFVGSLGTDLSFPLLASVNKSSEVAEEIFDTAMAEAGGTGGRVHRIRISETIESLMSQQRYLLRRALSESCISCYTKLYAFCKCFSLQDVLARDLFPTSEELISLERSFGMTLELSDIFGKQEFVTITTLNTPDDVGEKKAEVVDANCSHSAVSLDSLKPEDVGSIVLFEATKVLFCSRRVPEPVQRRYPNACWMRPLESSQNVLCVFSNGSHPAGTVRYLIEAQVIRCEQTLCFYALELSSLAKSAVDSHNPEYESHVLAKRRWRACQRPVHFPPRTGRKARDAAHSTVVHRTDNLESSSESENSMGALQSEPCLSSFPAICNGKKNFIVENQKKILSLSKKVTRPVATDYELSWELYRRKASSATRPNPPKGPPMHF